MFRFLFDYIRRLFRTGNLSEPPKSQPPSVDPPSDEAPPESDPSRKNSNTEHVEAPKSLEAIQEELARTKFAVMLLKKAREAKPGIVIDFYPSEYSLKIQMPQQQTLYLHNAFLEYSRCNKKNRQQVVNKWLRHFLFLKKMPEDFEDVEIDLFPSLRTRSYFEFARLRSMLQNRKMPLFPYQDVAEHFALSVSYDMHDSIVMISEKHLGDWNITFYEAMEVAMKNFNEKGCSFNCLKVEGQVLVYQASVGDGFDGSRLVLSDLIRTLEVYGDTIAQVSNTDSLIITGSEDQVGLQFMLAQAVGVYEKPHPLPPLLMRLDGDDWVPWLPPESNPMYKQFKLIRDFSVFSEYKEQQTLLTSLYEQSGKNMDVAIYQVMENDDGNKPAWSYTIWQKGKESLLPKAEQIVFTIDGNSPICVIPWDVALDVVGYIMKLQEFYPQRFLVQEFPTYRELEEMINLQTVDNGKTEP